MGKPSTTADNVVEWSADSGRPNTVVDRRSQDSPTRRRWQGNRSRTRILIPQPGACAGLKTGCRFETTCLITFAACALNPTRTHQITVAPRVQLSAVLPVHLVCLYRPCW